MRLNNPAYGDLPVNMAGIYLPFFWPPEETDRTPIFVAYLGGNDLSLSGSTAAAQSGSLHFVPLVCQRRQDSPVTRVRLQVIDVHLFVRVSLFMLTTRFLRR